MTTFSNPLSEEHRTFKNADSCILVIFGATGDLTARKLIPALYNLAREGQLPSHFACVGFARRPKSTEEFRHEMEAAVNQYSRSKPVDPALWKRFSEQLHYHQGQFDDDNAYETLNTFLNGLDRLIGTKGNRVYYLSTQPSDFLRIVEKLSQHKLLYPESTPDKWSRLIIEKPFGHDLKSAEDLQKELLKHLSENQIYRIDHYLGKETVQNLLVFRFGNPIFEAIWNRNYIDNIQITVAEEIGIGTRGRFWEEAGMVRDIIQNHVMQLLTLVAMEPPPSLSADDIRDEKVKVLEALRPIPLDQVDDYAVRGQYGEGLVYGKPAIKYREENNVAPDSKVETFAAFKLHVDNWRWHDVPFFIRAGKRLPMRASEIAITFKPAPGYLFRDAASSIETNVLVIRIQPDEGNSLKFNCKVPALSTVIQPVKMDFHYGTYFGTAPPEAYERLICDCMAGDNTLFAREDEVIQSWKLFTPILEHWQNQPVNNFPNYHSGTWGPKSANTLIEKTGRKWRII